MTNHPHIFQLHELYLAEKQPFRKVHRMIDLFESIIKMHTVVIMAEYFKRNQLSASAKGMLAAGLRTPSLGTWQLFSRELFKELCTENYKWLIPELEFDFILSDNELLSQLLKNDLVFPTFNKDKLSQLKIQKNKRKIKFDDVINIRNGYAHGATPTDAQCEADIKQFEPFLNKLLSLSWITQSKLVIVAEKVYLKAIDKEELLNLHPILLYKPEGDNSPFAFFNDLKNDKVGLINYPLSKHYREKDFYTEFHKYLPLQEWKKSGASDFNQRIEELTETFKGRLSERQKIRDFIASNNKGYFSIQGNPGIGKSALIAQVFKELKAEENKLPLNLIEYFIRRSSDKADALYMLNYLIKNTDAVFPAGRDIKAESKTPFGIKKQLFAKWRAYGESDTKNKLVFLIDGLDEGVENDILSYLPRETFNKILVIYGSRPAGTDALVSFWSELPVEWHTKLELTGLSKEDIRALLYDVANKYDLEKDSEWINYLQKRSEGNPLYLKLLCNALENGSITLNDFNSLPKEIDGYYKAILDRYSKMPDADALLNSLFVFATAFDCLTPAHLALINDFGPATQQRIMSTLIEVLYENPLTENVLDYQLFHESFREYLVKTYDKDLKKAETKIIAFCSKWKEQEGLWEQRYALQHYSRHLCKNINEAKLQTLVQLCKNKEYGDTQKKVLQGFNASKQLYQNTLQSCLDAAQNEESINVALQLVDLNYEEQNDATNIVAMLANNEIDLALQRIKDFGGPSAKEKKRQFTLYILCLNELTLLGSKDKPWRKDAIEKLLYQLNEQIVIGLINWDDFISSYLVYLIAVEIERLGLDSAILYKRTEMWNSDWITEVGEINQEGILFLETLTEFINDKWKKDTALSKIAIQLCRQNLVDQSIRFARKMSLDYKRSNTFILIKEKLIELGEIQEAKKNRLRNHYLFWIYVRTK